MAKKTTTKNYLKRDSIALRPAKVFNSIAHDKPESWMYEDSRGLDVIIHTANGAVSQRIPWRVVEGCIRRYRATKTSRARAKAKA